MNIDFLVNKENEKVIISNETGKMEMREYQDNIKDILSLENVVEKQQENLRSKKNKRANLPSKANDVDLKITKLKKSFKKFMKYFFLALVAIPLYCYLITVISKLIDGNGILYIEMKMIRDSFLTGVIMDSLVLVIVGFLIISPDCGLWNIRRLKKDKEDIEKLTNDLEVEIFLLEEELTKNKEELKQLAEQKEKKNIQNMSFEIQEVPDREALETQKAILIQMKNQKTYEEKQEQETAKMKDMILGKFKKNQNE